MLFCDGAAKNKLKCHLSKCDAHNKQLEGKLQDETSKVELLQADLAQIKTVFITCMLYSIKYFIVILMASVTLTIEFLQF